MRLLVQKSLAGGKTGVTSSKSHTMRAILLASMARGKSYVHNYLPSPDTEAMLLACNALGAKIERTEYTLSIDGTGANLQTPKQVIDVGNSGQVLRFVAAMATLLPDYTVITGDHSICTLRPMNPLLEGLQSAGAFAVSSKGDGHAPIIVRGKAKASIMTLDGQDSQPVSALLMLAAFLEGESTIKVRNAGEKPWISLTLHWLDRLGVQYTNQDFHTYTVVGQKNYAPFDYTVPGDWSSAAFPIAAALVTGQELLLQNMDFDDAQGDKEVVAALEQMGAKFTIDKDNRNLLVHPNQRLAGARINVNNIIDAVPILATVACFANSPTEIFGAEIARHKECDRLKAISAELGKMGAKIEELPDGLVIHPSILHGAKTESWHDHRIAMSVAVAALSCGETSINDVACISKSFPSFAATMQQLGAKIEEVL